MIGADVLHGAGNVVAGCVAGTRVCELDWSFASISFERESITCGSAGCVEAGVSA
jgi:hypothetical protein